MSEPAMEPPKQASQTQSRGAAASAPTCEPLMEFKEVFNFETFVRKQLVSAEQDMADTVRSSARLIGQERDGGILFSWDTKSSRSDELVTHVGWYSHASPAYRTLYRHSARADICSASVNFERTLIALTIRQQVEGSTVYESMVAEIQPQSRLFSLELTSNEYRKAQFLWPEVATPRNRMSRHHQTSRLLVIVPGLFVCIYTFKMQLMPLGAVLSEEPQKEIIDEKFSWYQWDPHSQWLYHAKFEKSSTAVQTSMSGKHSLILSCTSYSSSSSSQLIFSIALPLPYSEHFYSSMKTYYSSPFDFTVPIREMNLQVLHRREGYWCACLQHCTGIVPSSGTSVEYGDPDTPTGSKIDYSVYIIHNGHVMYGQVPLTEPTKEDKYIHFMLVSHFLAAYVPGFMLHLLNIGPRTDPCHHLAFGPADTPTFPVPTSAVGVSEPDDAPKEPILSAAVSTPFLSDYHSAVVECRSGAIYECSLSTKSFLQLFKSCNRPELKEDLLHLMIVCFRDHGRALSMIEHVCQTEMELVDHKLFAEFIVASSFANIHFDCNRYIAKQLPLTTSQSFRGKVVKNRDGSKLAWLKLTPLTNFLKQLLVQSDQRLVSSTPELLFSYSAKEDQPCETLCHTALTCQPTLPRVDMSTRTLPVKPASPTRSKGSPIFQHRKKKNTHSRDSRASRLFDTVTELTRRTLSYRSPSSQLGHDPFEMLSFLQPDEDLMDQLAEEASALRDHLLNIIAKDLPLKAKNIVFNSVTSYYAELQRHSCMLLFLIWQSLDFTDDSHPLSLPVNRLPQPQEQILFELLEAYHLAHLELGVPLPMGFHTLFTSLGYICLQPVLFLQYLRSGVFVPTQRFVDQLLSESESMDENIIFQVLSFLESQQANTALKKWENPTVQHLQASNPR